MQKIRAKIRKREKDGAKIEIRRNGTIIRRKGRENFQIFLHQA
jgi:hypothetical protein